ncbi:Hypothetical protein mma_1783 [Janthinobacterium sp. Marseille]|nr:Hypothetical protein mma_1783 [Janthinobacterium sp. Marseille]
MRNLLYFCLGLLISVGLFFVPYAYAQVPDVVGPFSPYPPQYNPYLPHPATGAPSLASQATSAGVNATASGVAQVKMPSGLRIPVSVANTATVSKAAIANASRVAVRALGPIGAAATAYEVYKAIQESGVTTCAPPDFFCKSDVTGLYPQTHYCYNAGANPNGTNCGAQPAPLCSSWNSTYVWKANSNGTFQCTAPNGGGWGAPTLYTVCPANYSLIAGMCSPTPTIPQVPMTDADIEQTLQEKMDADFNFNRRLYDSLQRDIAQRGLTSAADPITPNTPVSVVAPPVTTSERTVSITQTPRADGSTDTTTVKETTTVNPTTAGNTQGTVKTTYPSTTTQTTTVTNNVTNNTTTSTTVVNNAPVEPESKDDEDLSFVDPDMPEVPELYEQKYPDGIAGVWRDNKPNIESTQFWQGIKTMFPNFGGGQCPAWSMSFNIMPGANYGSLPFDTPCWIFQAIGLIILTTAAFTARKIIF